MPDPPAQTPAPQQAQVIMQSSSIQPPAPLSFSGDLAANWKHFHQVWTNYAIITGLEKQTEEYKVALFLHCIGSEALKTFNGFSFDDESDRKKLDKVIEKFEEYTVGRINETFERYRFNSRNQKPSEGIDAFVSALRNLAKTCNFGSLHDSLVRDRIVFGVQSKHTRQKLLQERKLTLEKCIDICRSNEATSSQMKEIASGSNLEAVNKVEYPTRGKGKLWWSDRKRRNDRNEKSRDDPPPTRVTKMCHFCGNKHEMNKKKCPAWGKQCQKCNGRNHFASVCKKDRRINQVVEDETDTDSDVEFITSICLEEEYVSQVSDNEYPKEIYAEMMINGSPLSFQVDCGASVNILPLKYVGNCAIKPSKKSLRMHVEWSKRHPSRLNTRDRA